MKENKSGSLFLSSLAYVGQELEEKNHPLEGELFYLSTFWLLTF